ncbi:hypothetical protein V5E97_26525 [Singulisphaera sp. Ch08]|uniref:GNAT family N-acetyltransferase n=1 Tax=Singulisphaera sp. Ch08 TaxID=3120278 RepID=A0AAU7C9B6_9BACT
MNPGEVRKPHDCLRFIPSRVEGLPEVAEVIVYPDRLELLSAETSLVFRFAEIAQWPRPAWLRKRLFRFGWRPRWLPVGDRDWFHPPRDRFFTFYTEPPITVFLTDEDREMGYGETLFRQVQDVIESGGFATYDLG